MILSSVSINNTRHSSSSRGLRDSVLAAGSELHDQGKKRWAFSAWLNIDWKKSFYSTQTLEPISWAFYIMGLMHNLIVYYYKDFIFQFLHDLTRCFKIYWLHIVGRLGPPFALCPWPRDGWFSFFLHSDEGDDYIYDVQYWRPCTRVVHQLSVSKGFVSCLLNEGIIENGTRD